MFFSWLVPDKQRPDWVTGAKSRVVLQGTGDWLMSLLPDDPENTILKKFKKNKPDDEQTDTDPAAPATGDGYSKPARDSLKKLIEKPAATLMPGQKRGAMDEIQSPSDDAAPIRPEPSDQISEFRARPIPELYLLDFDLEGDTLREECGVFGIFGHPDAAAITALGLHALQHRGQEAAGIVSFDGTRFHSANAGSASSATRFPAAK